MDEIVAICKKYEITLIEDAAEALGSEYKGKKLGTFGDFGIYSFNGNKIITTSGGGILVCQNKQMAEKALHCSTQANYGNFYYDHKEVGYNYRMSNISACIGLGQMEVLEDRIKTRRSNNLKYRELLSVNSEIKFHNELEHSFSNQWLTCIYFDNDAKVFSIIKRMQSDNTDCRPFWKPMHIQDLYKDCPYYGNNFSAKFYLQGICLPSGSNLKREEIEKISSLILKYS